MDICTIIAKNYAPFARVLARSFVEHHPEGRCFALVIDDIEGYLDAAKEPFELVTPADLDIADFDRMAALYDVLELSTAVKPWLLAYLLGERGCERIVYLDPDIQVLGSLERIDELVAEHGLVVTPHLTDAMPRDGLKPTETDILIAGAYNLGFVGLRRGPATDYLLDWWSERLRRDCVVAPELGYFVDQRWMDFAPGLVESFAILRDPEYNVAYWNLPRRQITRRDGDYLVNGRPLRFFHFSGFDPLTPTALSKHQTRIKLSAHRVLAALCAQYADRLLDEGHLEAKEWPYTYAELPHGITLAGVVRELYREIELTGGLPRSVFSAEGASEFLAYLNEPATVGGDVGVTRYLERVRDQRSDLRAAFGDLRGAGGRRLVWWAQTIGRAEVPIPASLVPDGNVPAATRLSDVGARGDDLGVNVCGYFSSVLGVGEIARQVVGALETQGVSIASVGLTAAHSPRGEAADASGVEAAVHDVNLICVNADMLSAFAADAGPEFFAGRRSIGYWWWEVNRFPERWRGAFGHLEEVWVGSEHVAEAIRPPASVPVLKMPVPVSLPEIEAFDRSTLGLPEGFCFLFVFDYNSVFERKNPLGAIAAFARAFEAGSGASLVLKSINHERDRAGHERLLDAVAGNTDVRLLDRYVSGAEKNALIAACDCYVSLHRSEGFGITLAEAMYLGRPAIATGYSGNLEFMTSENSYLVDHELVPIGAGADPYPPDGEWAEPDIDHAARLMREVFEDPLSAAERARRGQADVRAHHSPEAAGRAMAARLWATTTAPRRRRRSASVPPVADTARVAERIEAGPPGASPSRFGVARDAVRELVLRVMKPFTVHQRLVDLELLRAIHQLDEGLRGVAAQQSETDQLQAEVHAEIDQVVDKLHAELHAEPYMSRPLFELSEHPVAGLVSGFVEQRAQATDERERYREFEDLFRGSEQFIRARQRRYLKLIAGHGPVVDLGCGRGELLDLLREAGVEYAGVDLDAGMVEHCRRKGHETVSHGDAAASLANREDGSLGVVFSAQVIEHLPYEDVLCLLELSQRKLRPGGLLIAETVNPHSVQALKTFWVDLTHRHPIFPEVALALARLSGFESAFVFHPNGTGSYETDRVSAGEYALVATRGGTEVRAGARFGVDQLRPA